MDSHNIIILFFFFIAVSLPCAGERAPDPGALQAAVESKNLILVEQLLSRGADSCGTDALGRTPLYCAVAVESLPLVERLLKTQADPDIAGPDGMTPLMRAVISSREDLLLALLIGGANPNIVSDVVGEDGIKQSVSALSLAVDRGEFNLADRLIKCGADGLLLADSEIGAPNPLDLPVTQVPLDARIRRDMAFLADSASSPDWSSGTWPLHKAASSGEWRNLRDMLDEGADPDTPDPLGVTPLMAAAWHGNDAVVSLLLQREADPRVVDFKGRSSLCYAAGSGVETIVTSIISALDVSSLGNTKTNGFGEALSRDKESEMAATPEYYALIGSHPHILEILINRRTPPEAVDSEGVTLLMIAAWMSDFRAVRMLLPVTDGIWNNGPPGVAARDSAGRTALDWSLAAFERDRRIGREIGLPDRCSRNYSVARILARRNKKPSDYGTVLTIDVHKDVIESWSCGLNPGRVDDWYHLQPAPVPTLAGDGDLQLYRILRDEEPGASS